MKKIIALLASFAPAIAFAQTQVIQDANSLTARLNSLGNTVIVILISVAFIYIVWYTVKFIMADGESRAEFRQSIIWGVVGLAIILSIWGLVRILTNSFRTDTTAPVNQYPQNAFPPTIQ